jgi:ketosteroid isomerase-like protein
VSPEDLKALRAEYVAMSRQDWGAVLSMAHPDFELQTPRGGLDAGMVHGVDRARRAFENFFSPFEAVSVEPEAFFENGSQIVVFFVQRARPAGSTALVERRAAHLWTMRDGKAMKLQIFPRRDEALEAAGLASETRG